MTWSKILLRINLSDKSAKTEYISEDVLVDYVGGRGLGVKIYYDLSEPSVEPLSEENPLVLCTGPVSAIGPMSGRLSIVSKSPLTGTICESNVGGLFSKEMRFASCDAIVIEGKSDEPIYLKIGEDLDVEFVSAEDLWGRSTSYVYEKLKTYGSVGCIGVAGEKLVPYASIIFEGHHAAGRGGLGAVMGSKKVKAIVIKGNKRPEIKNREKYVEVINEINRLIKASTPLERGLKVFGTPILIDIVNYLECLPVSNFRYRSTENLGELSAEIILDKIGESRGCYACPLNCKKFDKNGRKLPEYESLWAFGPNNDNYDFESIVRLSNLCNEYGLDTISAGASMASKREIEGDFCMEEELHKIATFESDLSYGSFRYCKNKNMPEKSMSVKGLELPGYHPSALFGQALSYATSNRGGCHLRAYLVAPEIIGKPKLMRATNPAEKAGLVVILQNLSAAVSSLVMCLFSTFALSEVEYSKLLSSITGVDYTAEKLLQVGERIYNLERKFNVEAGIIDDTLPDRIFEIGPLSREIFREMLEEYYEIRGWTNGIPTGSKLRELKVIE